MAMTKIGENALISREAIRLKAYKDSVGVWTVGVGHTSAAGAPKVTPGLTITRAEAIAIFERDLVQYEAAVDKAVTKPMLDNERDAFVSICYNIGPNAFRTSTFVKRFNAGDKAGCAEAIMRWRKPAAIIGRRTAERDQFLMPYSVTLPKARSTDKGRVSERTTVRTAKAPGTSPEARAVNALVDAVQPPVPVDRVSNSPKGVLSGLWALLQGKPPVPVAERKAVRDEVKEERPDLAKDLGGMRLAGFGGLAASVLGGTDASGLLDTLKTSADSVRDTSASVKDLADVVIGAIRWGVSHWWIFGLAISIYVLFRVGWAVFKIYNYIQERRAITAVLRKGA